MLRVLRISVAVLASAATVVAVQGTSSASTVSSADTCAFNLAGRKIGCTEDALDCALIYTWRQGQWRLAGQEFDDKDLLRPDPQVAARLLRPGVWEVESRPVRRRLGIVEAMNSQRTRWRIKNRGGRVVATGRGPDGAEIGMLILRYDRDIFC